MAATASDVGGPERYLADSFRRFCRSIELCDDYLRGYYGLKLVGYVINSASLTANQSQTSNRLLSTLRQASKHQKSDSALPLPDIKTVERLNETATAKLAEIVRKSTAREAGWEGYDSAEIIAAKELINRDVTPITR